MVTHFSTDKAPGQDRSRVWREAIVSTFFPLDLQFRERDVFMGDLKSWRLGPLSLSRVECEGLSYRRQPYHVLNERDSSFLITFPERADIEFLQDGFEVHCKPGGFIVERSDLPYEFRHPQANMLWVLKVPGQLLRRRLSLPERFATMSFDGTHGVGGLLVDLLRNCPLRLPQIDQSMHEAIGRHVLELLALSLEGDDRVLGSNDTSIQRAHLYRIEHFVRRNLSDPQLSPQLIADACGISVRYLHQLFHGSGTTVTQWIQEQRLLACDDTLRNGRGAETVAEIAYRWGFTDQAQFCRKYKSYFGCTPSDAKQQGRKRNRAGLPEPPD